MQKKRLFITTPIYYSSGKPHIGHAYTTILADVIARFARACGKEVFFLTGMDEHGQKIQDTAKKNNLEVQAMLDTNAKLFKELWTALDIGYDKFIRTTDDYHKAVVQKIFSELLAKNYIYEGMWTGYYCVSCEENYSKDQAVEKDGKFYCKVGHELTFKEEKSYFLKVSQFSKWIQETISKPGFIIPTSRVNELTNSFLKTGLEDLSVTRTTFNWGIPVIENPKHVIYVWIDALSNYITALGYKQANDENFKKFWLDESTEIVHLMSKEITRFHCIYWPILLKMLDLRLPDKIISHGWVVTKEGKMSKSLGNVIDPHDYINQYGSDAFRYYIVRQVSYERDGIFSRELFENTFNTELANNYGNMITRTAGMLKKYTGSVVPELDKKSLDERENKLIGFADKEIASIAKKNDEHDIIAILDSVQNVYAALNKYIDESKPWELAKDPAKKPQLMNVLNLSFNYAVKLMIILKPILVKTSAKVEKLLHIDFDYANLNKDFANTKIDDIPPLFTRIVHKAN